jgi:hypothetical protein
MNCEQLQHILSALYHCSQTQDGLRLSTSCLYPSFEVVHVYVVKLGGGYQIHDGGGAGSSAWLHGRNDILITKEIDKAARKFRLQVNDGIMSAKAIAEEWIPSAVLSVANGSAHAAHSIVDHMVAAARGGVD